MQQTTAQPDAPAPFWIRHDPRFGMTGSTFSQPTRPGELRPEFLHDDCASLDAPGYIGIGGTRLDSSVMSNGIVCHMELADLGREHWAEPEPQPAEHCWAPIDDTCTYADKVGA